MRSPLQDVKHVRNLKMFQRMKFKEIIKKDIQDFWFDLFMM
jgi:hypothetical protein